MKKGFTLIELVVVVLIIGILSAIALPQYTMVVEKARLTEALIVIGNLKKAIELRLIEDPNISGHFIGEDATQYLDIDLESVCELEGNSCRGKYFTYYTEKDCAGDGSMCWTQISANRNDTDSGPGHIRLVSDFASGEWVNSCSSTTSIGSKLCKNLESQGWQRI